MTAMMALTSASAQNKYPWQDPKMPTADRVENLLGMLKPDEKVGLMMNKSASVDRLGIPSYNWWSEASASPATTGGARLATVCARAATPSIRNLSVWRLPSMRS